MLGLAGYVYNDPNGVTIELQGQEENISQFLVRLKGADKPPAAQIKTCEAVDIAVVEGQSEFVIRESESAGTALAQVTADMAVCPDLTTARTQRCPPLRCAISAQPSTRT